MSGALSLSVRGLRVRIGAAEILKGIDFSLDEPICVGVVGESGSGKTMFARSLMGLLPPGAVPSGAYEVGGAPFALDAKERDWRRVRGSEIGLVLQDPFTALDPLTKCGKQILLGAAAKGAVAAEAAVAAELAVASGTARGAEGNTPFRLDEALAEVGLPASVAGRYPFELSGGQRQRVVIAASLATQPRLLIADEATTALDVVTQREILDLLETLRVGRGMPLILITHDIGLIRERTDRVLVLKDGAVVEAGDTREVTTRPQSEYTKLLLEADRRIDDAAGSAAMGSDNAAGGRMPPLQDPVGATAFGRPLLRAEGLSKRFGAITALDDVSIEIHAGECVGVVGESGSGKTTLARCIVGLEQPDAGHIAFHGETPPQIVFQDPYSSLNPAHTVRYALEEALRAPGGGLPTAHAPTDDAAAGGWPALRLSAGQACRPPSAQGDPASTEGTASLRELLRLAELPEELLDRRPAKLSGGQRQRVAIARALATDPDLIVCDESVSALDVFTQNQILATIARLRRERGLAVLFITHDLSVVRALADRIYVMHDARVVEEGPVRQIFEAPGDPYTKILLASMTHGASQEPER
ncbi:MAG: ABC transporter ATP-binding protein [Clostridiales Family XIII bacterium]|jgi:peptide/nickel transport system ATP-binding protein|nr:ABC transporter ATP-binding protein [Clostridiales Family XIII bacterium]